MSDIRRQLQQFLIIAGLCKVKVLSKYLYIISSDYVLKYVELVLPKWKVEKKAEPMLTHINVN